MWGQVGSSVTTLVGLVLTVRLGLRYAERPRWHTLLYAVALGLFTLAASADASARLTGKVPELLYRLYWFAAAGLVGTMALGTGILIIPFMDRDGLGRLGAWLTAGTLALTAACMAWLLVEALRMPVAPAQLTLTAETFTKAPGTFVPPSGPKFPFVMTNSLGSLVIFAGALWSYWKTRARYTLTIALSALIFAMGGTAASMGGDALFYAAQLLGTFTLYTGVAGSVRQRAGSPARAGQNA